MQAERELRFGIFGTFDVENYGDLLFPLIAEAELSRRLSPLTLRPFSYHGKTPPDWPYHVTSLTELPGEVGGLDGIIIGGGHLLRFDKDVAPGYDPPSPFIHHPTGYWLTPALMALSGGLPVVWNAPGVHGDIPTWAEPLLEFAIGGSAYVSVRDERSRQALARFANGTEINVVPDTVFGVARLLDMGKPSADFIRLRDELGLADRYIVVQATPDLRPFARFVRNNPRVFAGYKLLALPTGPVHGDDDTIFGDGLPGIARLPFWPHPLLLAELIGHAASVVAVSLHLSISALAFGVPLFRPAHAFGGKYSILSGLDGVFRLDEEGGRDPAEFTGMLGRSGTSPAASAALERLAGHWDRIAAALLGAGKAPPGRQAVNSLLSKIPGLLAAGHDELAARQEQLTALYGSSSWRATVPLRSLGDMWRRRRA